MQRDPDAIRKILLAAEIAPHNWGLNSNDSHKIEGLENLDNDVVAYNMMLLIEESFLRGNTRKAIGSKGIPSSVVHGLTWQGHELLDAIRGESVWQKTKDALSKAGSFTIGSLLNLATEIGLAYAKKEAGLE